MLFVNKSCMYMKSKIVSVDCIVLTYNSERTIKSILSSIFSQSEKGYQLHQVIVHDDCSNDNTIRCATSFNDPRLKIISDNRRKGFALSFFTSLECSTADITIVLNDDIKISQRNFIQEIVKTFQKDTKIALVSSKIVPMNPRNFFERSAWVGFQAYQEYGETMHSGNNVFTCDGKVLCIRNHYKSLILSSKDDPFIRNLDHFLYFFIKENRLRYAYSKNAKAYFRLPSNPMDFINWQVRNMKSNELSRRRFQYLYNQSNAMNDIFRKIKIKHFFKYPLYSLYIFFIGLYCSYKKRFFNMKHVSLWDTVASTKYVD